MERRGMPGLRGSSFVSTLDRRRREAIGAGRRILRQLDTLMIAPNHPQLPGQNRRNGAQAWTTT